MINMTQSDLASLIGVSRQYLNELISGWNEDGYVSWRGNAPAIVFIDELQKLLSPLDEWMLESETWA
jgi:transcriptional regulator with XRE-family HTH domain